MVEKNGAYYRRYSDDIIVICKVEEIDFTKKYVENLILESEVKISTEKTETFRVQF